MSVLYCSIPFQVYWEFIQPKCWSIHLVHCEDYNKLQRKSKAYSKYCNTPSLWIWEVIPLKKKKKGIFYFSQQVNPNITFLGKGRWKWYSCFAGKVVQPSIRCSSFSAHFIYTGKDSWSLGISLLAGTGLWSAKYTRRSIYYLGKGLRTM